MNLSTIKSEMAETDIDLYADVDDDFDDSVSSNLNDTFDEAVAPLSTAGSKIDVKKLHVTSNGRNQSNRFQLFIGNLTWYYFSLITIISSIPSPQSEQKSLVKGLNLKAKRSHPCMRTLA